MISFRKVLFTLLAPLGAATIIGTGFATWVFGIQGVSVDGDSVNNNVSVTPEVENGDIKILSCPNLIVFSEGTQGASNLSDGINFYTNKVVSQGKEFAISMDVNNSSHRLSLVYDNTTNPEKMYFSWKKDEKSNVIAGELKKSTLSQIRNDDNYIGTWTGSVVSESQTLNVTLVLDANKNGTLTFENNQGEEYESKFTFEVRTSKEFTISMDNNNSRNRLSLVYDSTSNPEKMYFSWKKDEKSNVIAGELTKSTSSQIGDDDKYIGTWKGSVVSESQTLNVTLVLDANKNGTLTFENNQVTKFTFEERTSITDNITVTDSTFSFRYTYKNPDLIDENKTRYHLNVKMKLALESSSFPFTFNNYGSYLIYEYGKQGSEGYINFVLSSPNEERSNYELSFNLNSHKLNFIIDTVPVKVGNEVFPSGTYSGHTQDTDIPCTLKYDSSVTGEYNASITVGSMDHFLKIPDKFTSHCDEEGYFNIFDGDNEYYAQTNLNFNIDKSHLDTNREGPYYIDFTCQLANFLTYDSPDVKPIDFDKYVGLYIASILGEWTYKITVSADFTEIRG